MSPSIAVGFCFYQHHIEIKQPFSQADVTVTRLAASACFVGAGVQPHFICGVRSHKTCFSVRTHFNYLIVRVFLGCRRGNLIHLTGILRSAVSFFTLRYFEVLLYYQQCIPDSVF